MQSSTPAVPRAGSKWLIVLLIIGLALRILWFPGRFEERNGDEGAYLFDTLMLFEGMIPGHKAVPSGVMTWIGWAYLAGESAVHLLRPTPLEKSVPLMPRPVYVIDRTIFDNYRDITPLRSHLMCWNILFGLISIVAAWKFGRWASGLPGALLAGGTTAVLPLFLELSSTARPLTIALALVLLCFLALTRRRYGWAGALFGLAIGTRIEMATFVPLVAAMAITEEGWKAGLRTVIRCAGIALVAFLAISPWWIITWFGNLRSIVGVRLASASEQVTRSVLFREAFWINALLLPLLLALLAFGQTRLRPRGWLIPAAALLIIATILTHNNLHYQTVPVLTMILIGAMGIAVLPPRALPLVTALIVASLLLATVHATRQALAYRNAYVSDDSTAWVEKHVPPNTRLYWPFLISVFPLPTEASATAMWSEVTDDAAWRKKVGWAVGFGNSSTAKVALPRTTSDEIMLKERANVRGWFILGGRPDLPLPRYDVRQYGGSTIFGVMDPAAEFRKTGGVFMWRGLRLVGLGEPAASWTNNKNSGTFIYVSSDVHLIP